MRIAVDAMGGDRAPGVLVEGARLAMDEIGADVDILLVGREEALRSEIGAMSSSSRISIVEAPEVVGMGESALSALRKKRRSSIVTAMQLQKENQADAAISAGNTGAAVACSLVTLGRLPGVNRPAIASLFPTEHGQCIVLDVGANAECKPINLFQFGVMGSLYVSHMFGIEHPRVGLMSIGEERSKGNELVVQAHNLLAESSLHFIGNVEGRDVLLGTADVVICDGFVGNVLLKFTESVIHLLTASLREKALSSLRRKLGALLLKPAQHLQLMDSLVFRQLGDLAGDARVGKADRAGHVAAVGQVDLSEAGGGLVLVAQAAIGGAMGGAGHVGPCQTGGFFKAPPGGLGVKGGVAVDAVAHIAVLGAGLLDMDGAVFDEDSPDDHGAAVRTERFDRPRQPAMQGPNPAAVVGLGGAAGNVAG